MNQEYIQTVSAEEIPWHRLTTVYGRGTKFPKHFKVLEKMDDADMVRGVLEEISINVEHQSTLWHSTPFAVIFLVRIFTQAASKMKTDDTAEYVVKHLLKLFQVIATCYHDGDILEHAEPLTHFSDMLNEEYLWSETYDEDADIRRYEQDCVFPPDLFYSFYYYSFLALRSCKPTLLQIGGNEALELYRLLSE